MVASTSPTLRKHIHTLNSGVRIMNDDALNSSKSPVDSEPRFPNEIFAIIIDNLSNDLSSLRETSLVCKDFIDLSQRHIFRRIDLAMCSHSEPVYPPDLERIHRLSAILGGPQTVSWGIFVQSFHFCIPLGSAALATEILMKSLQNMPSLTDLGLTYPGYEHLQIIQNHCTQSLKRLSITSPYAYHSQHFQVFQKILASMSNLESLAMLDRHLESEEGDSFWILEPMTLILPNTLREVRFGGMELGILQAVVRGMKMSYPPMLRNVVVEFRQ
ncbi:hypothetical protein BT96DRAFT_458912 [Gymnopus androsaceus JB14]|uniref:F-box domain-containing protein n=1 Tax=Gymnopus androsaceus JB14 TaxID=1447944 RepID=A0A6A4IL23_9AGAR|nr:hypothetical protein BT96DRAFT_458912 [Gymnopus androsaceus JB14]